MPLLGGKKKPPSPTGMVNGMGPCNGSSNDLRTGVPNSSFHSGSGVGHNRKSQHNWRRAHKAKKEAEREAKVVQKSALHVDKIVRDLTDGRPFLMETPNQPIAKFLRSEIVVGNLLGRGVFARVYEIKDIDLHDVDDSEDYGESSNNIQHALDEAARDMIVLDDDSSGEVLDPPPTIDDRPFGADLEHRPLVPRQLSVIDEDENDDAEQQEGQGGDSGSDADATTAGTSSTAPVSAPPTPPLTPASQTMELQQPTTGEAGVGAPRNGGGGGRSAAAAANRLRFSTAQYDQHMISSSRLPHDQDSLRLRARETVRNGDGYALKHLTKTLLRNPKDFHLAAAALIVEAKYLSKLNHPNIMKIAGLAMCQKSVNNPSDSMPPRLHAGSNGEVDYARRPSSKPDGVGAGGGQYDSYFLVSERLTDTLDRRIRQWKRDQPTHKKLSEKTSNQKIQTWKQMIRKTSYALQISNALIYLHERKLLHRDLKPQNVGFIGDNQTICLFNFGLCREMRPVIGTVQEDPVTAMYGALSWKYTAVECFPQPIKQDPVDILSNTSAKLLGVQNFSSRSFGLESISHSLRGKKHRRRSARHSNEVEAMQELQRELQVVHEQYQEELRQDDQDYPEDLSESTRSKASTAGATGSSQRGVDETRRTMTVPEYDCKADVYSWAMVYYEMLTMNQPFSGMTQKEHLRKVAGPKGGQRPGVYQFDLTPSMISLLQRAWDQNPKKRPTMEIIGRNLQLILKELETLIKEEQKALLKEAGGTEDAVAALTSKEERAARRAKRKEEREKLKKKDKKKRITLARQSSALFNVVMKTSDNVFARNRYRKSDVRESIMDPPTGLMGLGGPKPIPGLEGTALLSPTQHSARDRASMTEIDVDALEYEAWDSEGDYDDDDEDISGGSFASEGDASSIVDHLNTVVTIDNSGKDADVDAAAASDDGKSADEIDADDESENKDVIGDAILAMKNSKSKKSLPSRDRNFSGQSGEGRTSRGERRRTKAGSLKSGKRRFQLFDPLGFQRRGTNRMSRRTMRLSRASVWMMRRDVKALVYTVLVVITVVFSCTAYYWYQRRQATWLGINLDDLGATNNETVAREILREAIVAECRHEMPTAHDPSAPMLFRGGALSPVDLDCVNKLERILEQKMVRVTGFDPSKIVVNEVGFLGVKRFDKPPPQKKKSRWKRKQVWKFFRNEPEKLTAPATSPDNIDPIPLLALGSPSSAVELLIPDGDCVVDSELEESCVGGDEQDPFEQLETEVVAVDEMPPLSPTSPPSPALTAEEPKKEKGWRETRAWKFVRDYPKQRHVMRTRKNVRQPGLFGYYAAPTPATVNNGGAPAGEHT